MSMILLLLLQLLQVLLVTDTMMMIITAPCPMLLLDWPLLNPGRANFGIRCPSCQPIEGA